MKYNSKQSFHADEERTLQDEPAIELETCRQLIDFAPAILWRAEAETFRFTFVSDYAEILLGYPVQRWISDPEFWKNHLYPEDREWVIASRSHAAKKDGEYDLEYRMVSSDGRALWVRELGQMHPQEEGGELVGVIVDLSKKRSSPQVLGDGKPWLRQIIDTIPVQIWSAEADGSIDFFNARFLSETGRTQEDIKGERWHGIVHPEDLDRILRAWHESLVAGTPYEQEERLLAGGQYRWFLVRAVPLRENGKVVRWFGSSTEIEAQKQAEVALRKSEERWRQVFENTRVGVALLDSSLHFIETNEAYQKMVGYSGEELRSMTSLEMTHEEDRPACQHLVDEMLAGQRDRFDTEMRYVRKNGDAIWVRLSGSSFGSGQDRLWVVMAEDITEPKRLRDALQLEDDQSRLLLDLGRQFVSKLDLREFFDAVLQGVRRLAGWDSAVVFLPDPAKQGMTVYLRSEDSYLPEAYTLPMDASVQGYVYRSGEPIAFRMEDLPAICPTFRKNKWMQELASAQHVQVGCVLPLIDEGRTVGVLFLTTRAAGDLANIDLGFLQNLADLIAISLSNALRYEQVKQAREKLVNAKQRIEDQIRAEFSFETIVGLSQAIKNVLRQVETVAPTDSTVLILGETGTGKELVARAIHDRSTRSDQSFIKVDCSAIPGTLMESELFGFEKGAFTGATAVRLGRFEIADKGTLFLDEVGDIPLELQPKLLRVLQDQAFERLGSNHTRHLDVRIVAATNRNLKEMVETGKFREDLYYRLRVFPITIPPLRERPEDIPPLVRHYVAKYAQRMKKEVKEIPTGAMDVFMRYPWPGNVRELQHFLERSVVLSRGSTLETPLRELEEVIQHRPSPAKPSPEARTMEEIERESILQALRDSNWVVGGPHGAAAKLGLKRTTLASRMERLGISRYRY